MDLTRSVSALTAVRGAPTGAVSGPVAAVSMALSRLNMELMLPLDTTHEAREIQLRAVRNLSGAQRVAIAVRMSDDLLSISTAGATKRKAAKTKTAN